MERIVNVRLPASLYDLLRQAAARERRSVTAQLAVTVERGLLADPAAVATVGGAAPATEDVQ